MPAMDILVLEHQADAPAGLFADWAAERAFELTTLGPPELDGWPDPRDHGAIVALGSDRSVHASTDGWIAAEIDFLRRAHDARVPVLGICFGAQALAAALGARVVRAPHVEIGWIDVARVGEGDIGPPITGPWFAWHEDAFEVPDRASTLGRTSVGAQGFRLDLSVGLQFHPEVTPEIVAAWVEGGRRELDEHRVEAAGVLAETDRRAPVTRARAMALFDAVASAWDGRG
jgi:GMP synthase-like glutamine amidotransferase